MEYLQSNQAETALPYLENAVRLNPNDLQAVRTLGKAHAILGHSESATELYLKEVQLAPDRGDAWLDLGTTYLQQVENDARLMTSTYRDTAYVNLRAAEVLAEEGKLIDAEEAYKAAIASPQTVPCRFRSMESRYCARRRLRRLENSSTKRSDLVLTADWRPLVWLLPRLPQGIRRLHSVDSRRWRLPTGPLFVRAFRFSAVRLRQNK